MWILQYYIRCVLLKCRVVYSSVFCIPMSCWSLHTNRPVVLHWLYCVEILHWYHNNLYLSLQRHSTFWWEIYGRCRASLILCKYDRQSSVLHNTHSIMYHRHLPEMLLFVGECLLIKVDRRAKLWLSNSHCSSNIILDIQWDNILTVVIWCMYLYPFPYLITILYVVHSKLQIYKLQSLYKLVVIYKRGTCINYTA